MPGRSRPTHFSRASSWFARYPLGLFAFFSATLLALSLCRDLTIEQPPDWLITASAGGVAIAHGRNLLYHPPGPPTFELSTPRSPLLRRLSGFSWWPRRSTSFALNPIVMYTVPLWIPLTLCGVPSAIAWRAHLRRRRRGPASCPSCGYDLRGLPASAPCPECGASRAAHPAP